jgi:2-C-methyl-D-erythritol 4-phosphate cytidylyltransferase
VYGSENFIKNMSTYQKIPAVIVAGGAGTRMKSPVRKQYLLIDGRPVLTHTLDIFGVCDVIGDIFLVIPEQDVSLCKEKILPLCRCKDKITLVRGGSERQDSVYNGISAIKTDDEMVIIHDGVRPLISVDIIEKCLEACKATGAAIVGIPASDTLKWVDQNGVIVSTLNRESIWLSQTPQCFRFDLLKKAHESAAIENFRGTDDASLVERMGIKVRIVIGNSYNIKITTNDDLVLARAIFNVRNEKI